MFRDDIYRISPTEASERPLSEPLASGEGTESYRRFDSAVPAFPQEESRVDHLDRREAALNARIAQFETIVRKTKLDMAERRDELQKFSDGVKAQSDDLARREQALRIRAEELGKREEAFRGKLADFSQNETAYLEKTEELIRKEARLNREAEEFESRSAAVLAQIAEQKGALDRLLTRIG